MGNKSFSVFVFNIPLCKIFSVSLFERSLSFPRKTRFRNPLIYKEFI